MDTRPWIQDTWYTTRRTPDGKPVPTARHGRGNRWRLLWWDNTTTPPKRRTKSFARKIDAEKEMAGLATELAKGTYAPPERRETQFSVIAETWLATRAHLAGSSYARYARAIELHLLPQWGHMPVARIRTEQIEAWVADLLAGTAPVAHAHPKPLKPASVRHIYTVLQMILKWAVKRDYLPRTPATDIRLPKPVERGHTYLTHADVEHIATAAGQVGAPKDTVLVYTLAYTGVRIGEATALQTGDLDPVAGLLSVSKTWTVNKAGKTVLSHATKHSGHRAVPVPGFLIDLLATLTENTTPQGWLFRQPGGQAVNIQNWRNRVFTPARKAAGLPATITPHSLRHTAASLAITAGADVKVVQQMLGHRDATETLNTYAHLWPDRLHEIADAMSTARELELRQQRMGGLKVIRGENGQIS